MAATAVTYEESVSFTKELLALRTSRPFSFQAGPGVTVRVVPHRRVLKASEEKLRYCEDLSLQTVRLDLEVYELGVRSYTSMYISAGHWSESPRAVFDNGVSHYLLIHDGRRFCAQQVNLRQYLTRRAGQLRLSVSPRFPKGGAVLTQRLLSWMKNNAQVGTRGKRLDMGQVINWQQLLRNLVLVGLTKQHLRGSQIVRSWVESLAPVQGDQEYESTDATVQDEYDEDDFQVEKQSPKDWSGLMLTDGPPPKPRSVSKLTGGGKVDFQEVNARAKEIGDAGEKLVLEWERTRLIECGRLDLAVQVQHVADLNDGAGYDILSFTPAGKQIYIEVKTTTGALHSAFYLSAGELSFSRRHKKSFRLYRLYDYAQQLERAHFFILQGDLSDQLDLEPTEYRARLKP